MLIANAKKHFHFVVADQLGRIYNHAFHERQALNVHSVFLKHAGANTKTICKKNAKINMDPSKKGNFCAGSSGSDSDA